MSEDGEGIDEVESAFGIVGGRRQSVGPDPDKWQAPLAPSSKFGVVIRPMQLRARQVFPEAQDSSAATAEVENGLDISNVDCVPVQDIAYAYSRCLSELE